MVIGIYNPYSNTVGGGGEQYMFTIASYFLPSHTVKYYTSNINEVEIAKKRFELPLSNLILKPDIFAHGSLVDKMKETHSLDIFITYSDGSIPLSFAKKTFVVFQFPVPWVSNVSLKNYLKNVHITGYVVNSLFTKHFIDKTFNTDAKLLYPSISLDSYSVGKKQNRILSVGRFTRGMNTKHQDRMISTFKEMIDKGLADWELVVAGATRDEDMDMIDKLRQSGSTYPIRILPNISRQELLTLYEESSIYWHAAGLDVNEFQNPEKVEHFGISTVEAMASGAVPMVYPAGGQKEIVDDQINGIYWKNTEDLRTKTFDLISNKKIIAKLSQNALKKAAMFDRKNSYKKMKDIFEMR